MELAGVLLALPYALRGSPTPELPFDASGNLTIPANYPFALATALQSVYEPCVLYKYVQTRLLRDRPRGLLSQALHGAIRELMRQHLVFTRNLELQPPKTLAAAQLQLQAPTAALRLCVAALNAEANGSNEMLDMLGEYTMHGDPVVRGHAETLSNAVQEPLARLRAQWEDFGDVGLDIYHEFYVVPIGKHGSSKHSSKHDFRLELGKLPRSISLEEAKHSLERGKAVHFVRDVCGDRQFSGDGRSFESIMAHTRHLLFQENLLLLHFRGLRDYMLLANGNFVDSLFRNDDGNFLMRPVRTADSQLAGEFFMTAWGDLCSTERPEIKDAVDAYIMEIGGQASDADVRVWEAFVGKYYLDSPPLWYIVDVECVKKYEKCFAALWRVRLAVYSLNESAYLLRNARRAQQLQSQQLENLHILMNATMLSIQEHLYYRVIDEQWCQFKRKIENVNVTLEQLKRAHGEFLDRVVAASATPERSRSVQELTRLALNLQYVLTVGNTIDGPAMSLLVREYAGAFET